MSFFVRRLLLCFIMPPIPGLTLFCRRWYAKIAPSGGTETSCANEGRVRYAQVPLVAHDDQEPPIVHTYLFLPPPPALSAADDEKKNPKKEKESHAQTTLVIFAPGTSQIHRGRTYAEKLAHGLGVPCLTFDYVGYGYGELHSLHPDHHRHQLATQGKQSRHQPPKKSSQDDKEVDEDEADLEEQTCFRTIEAVLRYASENLHYAPENMLLVGFSLGCASVLHAASTSYAAFRGAPFRGVALIAPFSSVLSNLEAVFCPSGWSPLYWMILMPLRLLSRKGFRERCNLFRNHLFFNADRETMAARVARGVVLFHASDDWMVSIRESLRLVRVARAAGLEKDQVELVPYARGGHVRVFDRNHDSMCLVLKSRFL
jgi:pimeloyl-ACP methyl ester carboxylesterase